MSTKTPDNGTILYESMYHGGSYVDIYQLPNLNLAPFVGDGINPGNENSEVIGSVEIAIIPSDIFCQYADTAVQCPHDTNVFYRYNNAYKTAPSPYLTDGSRNPAYYQTTSPSSTANCLADFNGKQNTQMLCGLATGQADWKTANTITNTANGTDYPAACCCWRFHTEGTQQGDWYLPACGELGYVLARFSKLNDIIEILQTIYTNLPIRLISTSNTWTSTEYNNIKVRGINMSSGILNDYEKNTEYLCTAFLRLN